MQVRIALPVNFSSVALVKRAQTQSQTALPPLECGEK